MLVLLGATCAQLSIAPSQRKPDFIGIFDARPTDARSVGCAIEGTACKVRNEGALRMRPGLVPQFRYSS
jgi:hypothetical protein